MKGLEWAYDQVVEGTPLFLASAEDLGNEYRGAYTAGTDSLEACARRLVLWQVTKVELQDICQQRESCRCGPQGLFHRWRRGRVASHDDHTMPSIPLEVKQNAPCPYFSTRALQRNNKREWFRARQLMLGRTAVQSLHHRAARCLGRRRSGCASARVSRLRVCHTGGPSLRGGGVGRGCARNLPLAASASEFSCAGPSISSCGC